MFGHLLDFSPRGWGRVWLWTVLGTLFCIAAAIYVDSYNFSVFDTATLQRAIAVDVLLPLFLAAPLLFFFTAKLRDLAVAHHDLCILAATDSLTGLYNRRAFTDRVDAYLHGLALAAQPGSGALLVIDVDNFKAINDNFGHDQGDRALRAIAEAIANILRPGDIVARIGGEEFGILLPGASQVQILTLSEAVRRAVTEAPFAPDGKPTCLSVSIGVATFQHAVGFSDLFRVADQQLYLAKQNGRNRISVSPADTREKPLAA